MSTAGTVLSTMIASKGYYRFSTTSASVYQCPYPDHCLGGSAHNMTCSKSSLGPLCVLCSEVSLYECMCARARVLIHLGAFPHASIQARA